jgi:hypothetical protein
VIPHYWSSHPPTEKERKVYHDYLTRPFIYRKGSGFNLPNERETGFDWFPGCKFEGKEMSLKGLIVIAPGYQPKWFENYFDGGLEKDLELAPISAEKSSQIIEDFLNQIENKIIRMPIACEYNPLLISACVLGVHFSKNDRNLVRSFLQRAAK